MNTAACKQQFQLRFTEECENISAIDSLADAAPSHGRTDGTGSAAIQIKCVEISEIERGRSLQIHAIHAVHAIHALQC